MKLPARFRPDPAVAWQTAVVVAAWVYLCGLHVDNDGLWYPGDAPRHAAGGQFWRDFVHDTPADPKGYALAYYARYPVLNLTSHPPLFHLAEAAAYAAFGASAFVAKGLVLTAALAVGLYTAAWARRWVGPGAGWAGAFVLLLPGMVRWSHAIMPNVPAMAVGMAALYHARRWLETAPGVSARGHRAVAAVLCLAAIGTYYTAGVVVLVILAWASALLPWRSIGGRRLLAVAAAGFLVLIPCAVVALKYAPLQVSWAIPAADTLARASTWWYYPNELWFLTGPYLLVLSAAGAAVGLAARPRRRETGVLLLWLAVIYVVFSCLPAREDRYVLLALPPLVFLAQLAVLAAAGAWPLAARGLTAAAAAGMLGVQAWLAPQGPVPESAGVREVARFLAEQAPDEPVFYDGLSPGVFTFHVQAGDSDRRRRVVLGNKLLYAYAFQPGWRDREFVSSPADVVAALRTRGGCRMLVVEDGPGTDRPDPARHLREAVRGPEFERVASFPTALGWRGPVRLDVYRLSGPVEPADEVELPFPILGAEAGYRVRPIAPRAANGPGP